MKTLLTLVLLLISMVGIGQDYILIKNYDTIWRDSLRIDWEPIKYELPKDTFIQESKYRWYNAATWTYIDSSYYFHQMTRLINAWKGYQQECWNDSTLVYGEPQYSTIVVPVDDRVKNYPENVKRLIVFNDSMFVTQVYTPTWYSHKQPTFEGFMEYLERRLK